MASTLRRRGGTSESAGNGALGGGDGASGSVVKTFQKLDLYARVDEDFVVQTAGGGRAFLVGLGLAVVLIVCQFLELFSSRTQEHVVVDTSLGGMMQVNLNITFHALGCDEVHIDAMDVAGDNQLNIEHDMWKQRLSPQGEPLGTIFTEEVGVNERPEPLPAGYCGPCYGAEAVDKSGCCNSCNDVIEAYRLKAWNVRDIKRTAEQCVRERAQPLSEVKEGEGCNIAGSMLVNQVAGNFHFAIGDSVVRDGRHIHQFSPAEAPGWNCSHTIEEITFGAIYPGMDNPLNGLEGIASEEDGTGLFQYFIKVVPTLYRRKALAPGTELGVAMEQAAIGLRQETIDKRQRYKRGEARKRRRRFRPKLLRTNQYTYSAQFTPYDPGHAEKWRKEHNVRDPLHRHFGPHGVRRKEAAQAGMVLPGVFFVYDMAPFMVQITPDRPPVSHILTRCLAIIGGVFSVANVIDSLVFHLGKRIDSARSVLG